MDIKLSIAYPSDPQTELRGNLKTCAMCPAGLSPACVKVSAKKEQQRNESKRSRRVAGKQKIKENEEKRKI